MLKFGFDEQDPIPEDAPVSFRVYRKKPVTIFASPIHEAFEVMTPNGAVHAEAGEYLVMGVEGELYPIKESIFKKTYEYADEEEISLHFDGEKSNALDKEPIHLREEVKRLEREVYK